MNKFHEVSDKYDTFVRTCFARADGASAVFTFKDGTTKRFRTPDEAEAYILKKYKGHIL